MLIEWREYWDFLGCYADMESKEGLQRLEDYLQQNLSLNHMLEQSIQQSVSATQDPINTSLELVDSIPIYDEVADKRYPHFEDNFVLSGGLENSFSYTEMMSDRFSNYGVKQLNEVFLDEGITNKNDSKNNDSLGDLCEVFSDLKLRSPDVSLNKTLHQNISNNSTISSNDTKNHNVASEALENFIKYNNSDEDDNGDDDYYTALGSDVGDFEDAHEWDDDDDKTLFIFGWVISFRFLSHFYWLF